ncbi:MAG: primosomal protein N' [Deltaproteobacteria bacterium]|nr:primosomal protein N' [Deltaproteobacteria bacterium]
MTRTSAYSIDVALPLPVQAPYAYRVPEELAGRIGVGARVLVPLGRRRMTGYVVGVSDALPERELKSVLAVPDSAPLFGERDLELYRWVSSYYFYPLGLTIHTALPSGLNEQYQARYALSGTAGEVPGGLGTGAHSVLAALAGDEPLSLAALEKKTGCAPLRSELQDLLERGLAVETFHKRGRTVAPCMENWYSAAQGSNSDGLRGRQLEVYAEIAAAGCAAQSALRGRFKNCGAQLKALLAKNLISCEQREVYRQPQQHATVMHEPVHCLTGEQRAATEPMRAALSERRYQAFLLHGVTGSGKTEVYLQLMQQVLERGQQCLFMVPEISLTVQLRDRISSRLSAPLAMLHSSLSASERFDAWRAIRRGDIKIIIGARSAVFASCADLGLIIVDEEHDASYKQDDSLRYNGRDLAVVKAQQAGCTVVLGSATPSLESYANALKGKYSLQHLSYRAAERSMPGVVIVDMKGEPTHARKKSPVLSTVLVRALRQRLSAGQQSLLLLNRRGFASALLCCQCGHTFRCPNCDVALIQHKNRNRLVCHYCDYSVRMPQECCACGSFFLMPLGWGTERLEAELKVLLPEARIARLDRDTVAARRSILTGALQGDIDVLVGTQMIAKGLHLPGVTLVGVISADQILGFPDYRSGERAFQLLTQVAGRAGRGSVAGEVIIQTYNPDHYSLRCAQQHDFKGFYRQEMRFRTQLNYPPLSRMINIRCEGEDRQQVARQAECMGEIARELCSSHNFGDRVTVLGPAQAPWEKLKNRYRHQLLLRSSDLNAMRSFCSRLLELSGKACPRDVRVIVDVDPFFLM